MSINFYTTGFYPSFKANNKKDNNLNELSLHSQGDTFCLSSQKDEVTDLEKRKAEFFHSSKIGLLYRNNINMRLGKISEIQPITPEYLEQLWQETRQKEIEIQKKVDKNRALYKSMKYETGPKNTEKEDVVSKMIMNNGYKLLNTVKLLNRATEKYENAYIISDRDNTIELYCNNEKLGELNITDYNGLNIAVDFNKTSKEYANGEFLCIDSLETKNKGLDASKYRGIGTQLLKQAVIESQKRGFGGRIGLIASMWDEQGRAARDFYKHVGMDTASTEDYYVFILPENKIANFLEKE